MSIKLTNRRCFLVSLSTVFTAIGIAPLLHTKIAPANTFVAIFKFCAPVNLEKNLALEHLKWEKSIEITKLNNLFLKNGQLIKYNYSISDLEVVYYYEFRNKASYELWGSEIRKNNLFDLKAVSQNIKMSRNLNYKNT